MFAQLAAIAVASQAKNLEIGDPAPPLQVAEWIKGAPVSRYEPGTTYLVEFWAVWCGPCIAGMPHLSALQKRHGDKLRVIGVTSLDAYGNSLDAVHAFMKKKEDVISYSIAWDAPTDDKYLGVFQGKTNHALMRAAKLISFPVAVVVDGRGKVAMIGNPSQMDDDLDKVVRGKWDLDVAKKKRAEVVDAEAKMAQVEELLKKGDRSAVLVIGKTIVKSAAWDDARLMLWLSNQYAAGSISPTKEEFGLAIACAEQAVKLTRRIDPGYLNNLATLRFKMGDVDAAIRIEREAVEKSEGPFKEAQQAELKKFLAAKKGGG